MVAAPALMRTALVTDDARLAAVISCAHARQGAYFPVLDGPRLTRPDPEAEVLRRNNALARAQAERVLIGGLEPGAVEAMRAALPRTRVTVVESAVDAEKLLPASVRARDPVAWGADNIGLGVLTAMRKGTWITFGEDASPNGPLPSESGHVVVCEADDALTQVIAANYAFSLGAGLSLVPAAPEAGSNELLEELYSLYEQHRSPSDILRGCIDRLRALAGPIEVPRGGSVTFITRRLPFGLAFPDAPSTHLFSYPDLGIAIVHGFAAEQPATNGMKVALLIDPGTTEAEEIEATARGLAAKRLLVRGLPGPAANVRDVGQEVELFPYDLLMFATHCGDAPGHRWTYDFTDSEGLDRRLVVDIALSVGRENAEGLLPILKFMRFHSLDGVDWTDPDKKKDLYVGTAISDWADRERRDQMEPTLKEHIPRVAGSAALQMHDHNYIPMHSSLAANSTPIIFNNACASWHELAGRFFFAGARAYIGTLFPVTSAEAAEVAVAALTKHFGKSLPEALWLAQAEVYGESPRRPYVVNGTYPQVLRSTKLDVPAVLVRRITLERAAWAKRLAEATDAKQADHCRSVVSYYEEQLRRRRPAGS